MWVPGAHPLTLSISNCGEGVAIALTPMAFYEVVMAKAFRTLVDDGTEYGWNRLRAAGKLRIPSSTGVAGPRKFSS